MSTNSRWWFADLLLALVLTGIGGFAAYAGIGGRAQVALVLPLVVFLPGYVFISALFPEGGKSDGRTFGNDKNDAAYALGGPERVGLAVTISVAVVPIVAAIANFTPWGIRLRPILVGVLAFTAFFTLVALARRVRVPTERRYTPGLPGLLFSSSGRRSGGRTMTILNIGIVISFLLVASSLGFAVLNPPQGEQFTEFYVDTQNIDSNTNTLYQADLGNDGVTANVINHENERTQYTVVAVLQRVEDGSVTEQSQFDEQQVTVADGARGQVTLTGDQSISGDNVRILLQLYKGNPSGEPYLTNPVWLSEQSPPQQGNSDTGDGSDENQNEGNSGSGNGDGQSDGNSGDNQNGNDGDAGNGGAGDGDGNAGNGNGGEQTTQPPETGTTTTTSAPGTTTSAGTTQPGTTTTETGGTTQPGETTTTTTDDGFFSSLSSNGLSG
ncbi:DUF1616 domain-containing protein [Haladaptatus cibarius]|uniref:DUF1616 domain-containing protein n=1 Tax=Haladaptatus cibarius TaxID=453847 RepID=UPI000679B71E|nr:DUF1616 domain-containing protein [Haladaptatus cibarius]